MRQFPWSGKLSFTGGIERFESGNVKIQRHCGTAMPRDRNFVYSKIPYIYIRIIKDAENVKWNFILRRYDGQEIPTLCSNMHPGLRIAIGSGLRSE